MRAPLFPLPTTVLFPGARMPLHIFEPRYRRMLADALATDRRIAMGLAVDGGIRPLCGVGRIVRHEPFADGTSDIVLEGECRARILAVAKQEGGYLMADLDRLEETADPAGARGLAEPLRAVLEASFRAVHGEKGEPLLAGLLAGEEGAGRLADLAAELLLEHPMQRQRVLEALDPLERLRAAALPLGIRLAPPPPLPPSGPALN